MEFDPCAYAQIGGGHYFRHRLGSLGPFVAFCGQSSTIFCLRARNRLRSDFSAVSSLSCFIWDCHGWSVWQCSSYCTGRLPNRSTQNNVRNSTGRLRVWLPTCHSVLESIGKHHISRTETTLLVFRWSANPNYNWPFIPSRDESFPRANAYEMNLEIKPPQHLSRRERMLLEIMDLSLSICFFLRQESTSW
jgi:hypothetical protein